MFVKSIIIAFLVIICILIIVSLIEEKILNENVKLQELIKIKENREHILFQALHLIKFDIQTALRKETEQAEKFQILTEICNFIDNLDKVSKGN